MTQILNRRSFVAGTSISALHLFVLGCTAKSKTGTQDRITLKNTERTPAAPQGLGDFVAHSGPISPVGDFKYVVIQQGGQRLSDGHIMGAQPDGMACFQNAKGEYVLLRNQELGALKFLSKYGVNTAIFKDGQRPVDCYDKDMFGGVIRTVLDPNQLAKDFEGPMGSTSKSLVESHYTLLGTDRNCAGGAFEDYWITCEESSAPNHGYAFLTHKDDQGLPKPRRIDTWGRFHREAVCVHKDTGITYMTEDRRDGCLYRFVPKSADKPFGEGELQALKLVGITETDPYPAPPRDQLPKRILKPGQSWSTSWVKVDDPSAAEIFCREQAQAKGAAKFNRCEGITQDATGIWFVASTGGPAKAGQIFRLSHPDANGVQRLHLAYEVVDRAVLSCPDNLVAAPWGDIVMAEDNYDRTDRAKTQHVRCMKGDGTVYPLLRLNNEGMGWRKAGPEFTGACFSPDGKYLFVNLQSPLNLTIAVTGSWPTS